MQRRFSRIRRLERPVAAMWTSSSMALRSQRNRSVQGSSYTVQQLTHTEGAKKTIFAVNFLLSEQAVFAPFRLRVKNPAGMQALFATAEREWVKKGAACGNG